MTLEAFKGFHILAIQLHRQFELALRNYVHQGILTDNHIYFRTKTILKFETQGFDQSAIFEAVKKEEDVLLSWYALYN